MAKRKTVKLSGLFKEWCWHCSALTFWDWFFWRDGEPDLKCLRCGHGRLFIKLSIAE